MDFDVFNFRLNLSKYSIVVFNNSCNPFLLVLIRTISSANSKAGIWNDYYSAIGSNYTPFLVLSNAGPKSSSKRLKGRGDKVHPCLIPTFDSIELYKMLSILRLSFVV